MLLWGARLDRRRGGSNGVTPLRRVVVNDRRAGNLAARANDSSRSIFDLRDGLAYSCWNWNFAGGVMKHYTLGCNVNFCHWIFPLLKFELRGVAD